MRHVIFFVAILCLSGAPARADWTQYDPVLRIGGPGWKNVLFILWSHRNRASARAQDEIVRKLSSDIRKKNVTLFLYQIAGSDEDEIREASIFLCAPSGNYGRLIARYLDLLAEQKEEYSPALFRKLIAPATDKLGLPSNLSDCATGRPGFERATALNVHREALKRNYAYDHLPVFILNGRVIDVHGVNDIRARFLTQ